MWIGFGYVIPSAVCSKWFPDRRGFIIGMVVAGYGAGSGIFGPLGNVVCSGNNTEEFMTCEFDPGETDRVRAAFPFLNLSK